MHKLPGQELLLLHHEVLRPQFRKRLQLQLQKKTLTSLDKRLKPVGHTVNIRAWVARCAHFICGKINYSYRMYIFLEALQE